ncbi:MAG: flavodoxin domain-containing protein [Caldisericia bacterium]
MKTLVAYATKSGTSEKCANLIAKEFDNVDIVNLSETAQPQFLEYDLIIAGGPIRMGNLHAHLIRFLKANIRKLEKMNIALFICCMEQGEKLQEHIEKGFPKQLREVALAISHLGAELNWEKMGMLERAMMKKLFHPRRLMNLVSMRMQ